MPQVTFASRESLLLLLPFGSSPTQLLLPRPLTIAPVTWDDSSLAYLTIFVKSIELLRGAIERSTT
jgi:hypothetical protein